MQLCCLPLALAPVQLHPLPYLWTQEHPNHTQAHPGRGTHTHELTGPSNTRKHGSGTQSYSRLFWSWLAMQLCNFRHICPFWSTSLSGPVSSSLINSCHYLQAVSRTQPFPTISTAATLVQATIISYPNYYNGLCPELPASNLWLLKSGHSPAKWILLNLDRIMSLLGSEPCNGSLPYSEQKPESL